MSRARWVLVGVGGAVAALVAFVLVWFQPQKLVIDDKVNEPPVPADARLAEGPFRSLEHKTTGVARVLRLDDGRRVLRFERFDTSNGPDLRVYLSKARPDGPWGAFDDDYVELGKLKGNKGDQNYDIPAGTDLSTYSSAVIWCRRFSVPFAVAPIGG